MTGWFSLGFLHRQPPGMRLGIFLAKEYPAHKSSWLAGFIPDHTPAGVGARREIVIQSCNIELYGHWSNPAAPAPTFRAVYTKIGLRQALQRGVTEKSPTIFMAGL